MVDEITGVGFASNKRKRIPYLFLCDISGTMSGKPIEELDRAYELMRSYLADPNNKLAGTDVEAGVIEYGWRANERVPFTEGKSLPAHRFPHTEEQTAMGAAIDLGLDKIKARKSLYRKNGIEWHRPGLIIMTDGKPTDMDVFEKAAARLNEARNKKRVAVYPIGIGKFADMDALNKLAPARRLDASQIADFFEVLSRSASESAESGREISEQENWIKFDDRMALKGMEGLG
jgi:uncharacterized protein YegL